MKFIHTADWHLGNTMHDIDRTTETEAFLNWLQGEILSSGAQALVIAGDVFDVVNPSNGAKAQYYKFLASLFGTDCSNVIVVGGNHDSGALLDAPAAVLNALNVKVVGSINGRSLDDMVVELKDSRGNAIGICCAVPFMRDLELDGFYRETSENAAEKTDLLKRLYEDVYARAVELRGDRDIPIIATGHLYASDLSGRDSEADVSLNAQDATSEKENEGEARQDDGVRDVVGTLGNVSVDAFPSGLDYVALGHIHYATKVAGNARIRYSGSPFVMGFDEAGRKHCVLSVETSAGVEPRVSRLNVPPTIRYEQFQGDLETLKKRLVQLEKDLLQERERQQKSAETYVDLLLTSGEMLNLTEALANEETGKHFVVKRHRLGRNVLRSGSAMAGDGVISTCQYSRNDYFKMLIASRMGKDADSEEVSSMFNTFKEMFKEAQDLADRGVDVDGAEN